MPASEAAVLYYRRCGPGDGPDLRVTFPGASAADGTLAVQQCDFAWERPQRPPPQPRFGSPRGAAHTSPTSAEDIKLELLDASSRDRPGSSGRHLRLLVLTWNVGNAMPSESELHNWLPEGGGDLEMVVVGLQECRYSLPRNATRRESGGRRSSPAPRSPRTATVLRMPSAKKGSKSAPDQFPNSLGPFGVRSCRLPVLDVAASRYSMPLTDGVARLADARVACEAPLSAPVELPWCEALRKRLGVPPNAAAVRWAYQTDAETEEFTKGLSTAARLQIQGDPDCALLLYGGWVFVDTMGACCFACTFNPGDALSFGPSEKVQGDDAARLAQRLTDEQRLWPVALEDLVKAGARHYAWLAPGEQLPEAPEAAVPNGGFLYTLAPKGDTSRSPLRGRVCDLGVTVVIFPILDRVRERSPVAAEFSGLQCAESGFASSGIPRFAEEGDGDEPRQRTDSPDSQRGRSGLQSSPSRSCFRHVTAQWDDSSSASEEAEAAGEAHFTGLVADHLGPDWQVVREESLQQMRIAVYTRQSLAVTRVEGTHSACGLAHVYGNKGAVCVCLNVRSTSLCFVSCHLAAHIHKHRRRDEDCQEILREARMRDTSLELPVQFDHLFWLGDLNYRIDFQLKGAAVTAAAAAMGRSADFYGPGQSERNVAEDHTRAKKYIEAQDWAGLMTYDQLRVSRRAGRAFCLFEEGDYNFPPTFKVKPGSAEVEYQKKRVPSYCDRILWRSAPHCSGAVQLSSLAAVPAVTTSDHKPVVGEFLVQPTRGPPMELLLPLAQQRHAAAIYIHRLEAEGLYAADSTGKSDPYVVFRSNPAELLGYDSRRAPKTDYIDQTLDPVWTDLQVPVLRPLVRPEHCAVVLPDCSLILDLYDKDYLGNDYLGAAAVRLAPTAVSRPGEARAHDDSQSMFKVVFEADVVRANVREGCIRGELHVDCSSTAASRANVRRSRGGCCSIA